MSDTGAGNSNMRSQLIWASLFPLAFFGLLSMLVTASALNQMMSGLVTQRNTAQAQVVAALVANDFPPSPEKLNNALQSLEPVRGSQLYLVDASGQLTFSSGPTRLPVPPEELSALIQGQIPASRLLDSTVSADEVMISYAPLPGRPQAGAAAANPALFDHRKGGEANGVSSLDCR